MLAHSADPGPPLFPHVLLRWEPSLPVALAVALAAGLYLKGVVVVRRRHPDNPNPAARTAAFLSGLVVMVIALMSPIEAYDTALFSWHMVQHILITMLAAPLLLLGGPVTLALRAAPAGVRRHVLQPVLHSRILGVATHPVVAWCLFAGVMWGSHFSGLFDASLGSPAVHQLEHVLFLSAALLFWWPVLGVDPGPRRPSFPVRAIYVFLAMPQNTFLALAIFSARVVRYRHYSAPARSWGVDPLTDQHTAGGIMWVAGDLVFLMALIVVMAMWARHEERMAVILDAQLDAQLDAEAQRTRTSRSTAMETNSSPR